MINVVFKNLEKSELAKDAVFERIVPLFEKFPELKKEMIIFTLSMDNSPIQAGPDLFKVKMQLKAGRYKGVVLEKSALNLYSALAELIDTVHERLKRSDEKKRNIQRSHQRKKKEKITNHSLEEHTYSNEY